MNKRLLMKTMQYSADVVKEVQEYSKFMDTYFEKEENRERHNELYIAYENMSNQLKMKAKQRGLID